MQSALPDRGLRPRLRTAERQIGAARMHSARPEAPPPRPRVGDPAAAAAPGSAFACGPAGVVHFAVGITNSAPLPMLSGQRCITLFCRV
jgi:hypothetical protein